MKKDISFRLFKVVNKSIKTENSLLFTRLSASLDEGKKFVESRIMKLKDNDSSDEDVLGYFAKTKEYIYGVMMRIAYAKDVPELPADFAKGESINIDKILEEAEKKYKGRNKMVCKSFYHFLIYDDFIVTDLPKSRPITCFQNYMNWLLMLCDDMCFSINPVIETGKIQLMRLKSVVFKDAFEPMPHEKTSAIKRTFDSFLRKMVEDDDIDMKTLHNDKIISASLKVEFDRPGKMSVKDYEKRMSAVLKTVEKPDNVVFIMNGGKQIAGNELLYSRVETLENDISFSDADYIYAMKNVINGYVSESKK